MSYERSNYDDNVYYDDFLVWDCSDSWWDHEFNEHQLSGWRGEMWIDEYEDDGYED